MSLGDTLLQLLFSQVILISSIPLSSYKYYILTFTITITMIIIVTSTTISLLNANENCELQVINV